MVGIEPTPLSPKDVIPSGHLLHGDVDRGCAYTCTPFYRGASIFGLQHHKVPLTGLEPVTFPLRGLLYLQ